MAFRSEHGAAVGVAIVEAQARKEHSNLKINLLQSTVAGTMATRSAAPRATVACGRDPLGGNHRTTISYHDIVRRHSSGSSTSDRRVTGFRTEQIFPGAVN